MTDKTKQKKRSTTLDSIFYYMAKIAREYIINGKGQFSISNDPSDTYVNFSKVPYPTQNGVMNTVRDKICKINPNPRFTTDFGNLSFTHIDENKNKSSITLYPMPSFQNGIIFIGHVMPYSHNPVTPIDIAFDVFNLKRVDAATINALTKLTKDAQVYTL